MVNDDKMRKDEGEWISHIRTLFAGACADGFVDDGAALPSVSNASVRVVTSDVVVQDVHFSLKLSSPESAGHRAVVQNLSDLAAMAATPVGFVWTLALPPAWLDAKESDGDGDALLTRFVSGAADAARMYGLPLFGGDLSSTAGPMTCSVAAFGDAPTDYPRRDGANDGDRIFVGRRLGASALGLRSLRGDAPSSLVDDTALSSAKHHHQWPAPQLDLGHRLGSVATSLMDISDGLALDLWRMVEASKCGARLHPQWNSCVAAGATEADALFGGEDYALLFAVPPSGVGLVETWEDVIEIGIFDAALTSVRFPTGELVPRKGFDHLRQDVEPS